MRYEQYKAMQDIREIEFRDNGLNTNTKIYFEVRATALRVPAFTHKDFHYVHTRPSTKGAPPRNYNSTLGVHNSSLKHNHLYTRGKAQSQSKEKCLQLCDPMITNNTQ